MSVIGISPSLMQINFFIVHITSLAFNVLFANFMCDEYNYILEINVADNVLSIAVNMSKVESAHAVLLRSSQGYKEETKHGSKLQPVEVHKGSLLVYLDFLTAKRMQEKYGQVMNYKVADRCDNHQSETFLFSTGSSILRITKVQQDFLLGIKQTECRVEVLKRLEWTASLAIGSEVYVTIATIPAPVKGIVRYIGKLPGEEGRKFGIEIMVCIYTVIYKLM